MKIRGQLIVAFLIITALPFFLMTVCFHVILSNQTTILEKSYQTKTSTVGILLNPMQILYTITLRDYESLVQTADTNPDQFLDQSYLVEISTTLEGRDSFLIIRRNGTDYFVGDNNLTGELSPLPGFSQYQKGSNTGLYLDRSNPSLIKSKDFYFSDHSQGQLFLITDMTRLLPRWTNAVHKLLLCMLIIILITGCLLVLWIYNSIVRPLNILRIATMHIGSGHLDMPVRVPSTDEIGELCRDFEEMRIRLKEMIDERMQYEQDTRELISNMAHDLQTPITSIKGYAEGILDGVANTPEKQEKYIKTIHSKAVDMSYLIDELSVFAKVEQNSLPYHFIPIRLHDYFLDFIEETTFDLETLNIRLEYENYTARDTKILADPEQLKRVLSNIIGNAVKYINKEEGIISLRITDVPIPEPIPPLYRQINKDGSDLSPAKKPEEFIQIQITDNGPGIAEKDLLHVFRRFYRADSSRNSSKRGSGLGLAIVARIVADHGGRVWAESKEGQGTSIFFTLKKAGK